MASKKLEKGSAEWQFFQDFWRFRQEYYEPEEDDEWFEKLVNNATLLYEKYKNSDFKEFALKLIIAHVEDIDRRFNGK